MSVDMSGKRFGSLSVVSKHGVATDRQVTWACACDCGGSAIVKGGNLRSGHTRSCGCRSREVSRAKATGPREALGLSHSPIYKVWRAMLNRCHDPKAPNFYLYGGRGIQVCPAWWEFLTFYEQFGKTRPTRLHTIDRVDNYDGYWLGNVRWATAKEQANNRRPPSEWSRRIKAEQHELQAD